MTQTLPFDLAPQGKPVGWAVIGLGMGMCHANLIQHTPGLKLVALCDIDPQRLARGGEKFPGTTLYPNIDRLLQDDRVQGVSVVIPHNQHFPAARQTLAAGRHTVIDKPFCLTVEQGRRIIAAARKHRRLLSVFHNRRWDADFVTMRRLIERGVIGRPRYIESRVSSAWRMRKGPWRADRRQMGGLLYDWAAHCIDQCLLLMPGRAVTVYGLAQRDIPCEKGFDVEDRAQVQINFDDGAAAIVAWNLSSPAPQPRWIIEGDQGGIRSDREVSSNLDSKNEGGVSLYIVGKDRKCEPKVVPFAKTTWLGYYRNVSQALRGQAALNVKPEQALRHVAICEAMYRSVKSGQVEKLPRAVFAG
jgi:scyllo-inositol 2-dehydrogenase (NADP+)